MKSTHTEIPFFQTESFFKDGEKVYIHLSTDFPEFVDVLHSHEFIELVYVLSGEAVHTVGNKQYTVKCGDVTLINSSATHKFTPVNEDNERFVAYDLMFTPDFFDAINIKMSSFEALKNCFLFYSMFPDEVSGQPDLHISGKKFSSYGELFTKIYNEFKNREKGYIELIRAYVIELIIKLFRDIEQAGTISLSPAKIDTVWRAVSFMKNNYNVSLSVGEIAAKVFLGPDYFRKLFREVTGSSVSAFLQDIRIDEACRLLRTTDEPIKDIGMKIGYGDQKSFYQAFKKLTGKTPKEYREGK
ncbi:MAG: helix-turn-helix domain-containing protein [Clostridia bacterium]|nr:helix-turn-helix domain-containing protein [Clostridia bacterium]